MNYAVAVIGGGLALALVYYYVPVYGGVHWFTGPVRTLDVGEGLVLPVGDQDTSDLETWRRVDESEGKEDVKDEHGGKEKGQG